MAAAKKKAARLKASLVFIDESGLLFAPLRHRSWAPRGRTPVLRQRNDAHHKVSAIAALCVSPDRARVRCFFRLYPDANIKARHIVGFLRNLQRHLRSPIVLLWDRFSAHRAVLIQDYCRRVRTLRLVFFPAYAPELDPVEYLWGYLKTRPLANFTPLNLEALARTARRHTRRLQRSEALLRSFIRHSPLSLRL